MANERPNTEVFVVSAIGVDAGSLGDRDLKRIGDAAVKRGIIMQKL